MKALCSLAAAVVLAGCAAAVVPPASPSPGGDDGPPAVRREFRGVWVAAVANIDWPSRPGLSSAQQQAELLAILDRAQHLRLNAVVLHVRPAADALYASELEPWSEYLTGQQGQAPEPFYDPLEFAVLEAHRRGLELHAWFNPYRARHPSARGELAATHLSRTRPELVKRYGTHLWMDPGEPGVQDQTARVILDVVRRYDVDGVHLDDYFYPYKERDAAGRILEFPDSASYARYQQAGGRLGRDDWRRRNVDQLVERLYREIKREKPWVKFGISPFSIWRPGYPAQIRGFDAYAELYADSRKWLREGWVDYWTPQLYFPIAQTNVSYPVLLNWWSEQNVHGRNLWPGNFTSRAGEHGPWPTSELIAQIYTTRGHPDASGNVHFSMRSLMRDPVLALSLDTAAYREPALVPASPWLWKGRPGAPGVELQAGEQPGAVTLRLQPTGRTPTALWVVRARYAEGWVTDVVPGWSRSHTLRRGAAPPSRVIVSAVDRVGNEGPAVTVR